MGVTLVDHPDPIPLVGRQSEIESIEDLLDRVSGETGVLIFSGQAGIGKTALLDFAAATAAVRGLRVLRCAGVEFEADVSFLSLSQLLLPLRGEIGDLTSEYSDALVVALGLGHGPAPRRLLLCNAVLALLTEAARREPILLVIDDLPWLDRASAAVLSFVARAISATPVGFLGAARLEEGSFFDRLGLPERRIEPLDTSSAHALVRQRFPDLEGSVRRRLVAESEGSPLALLELAEGLRALQRTALDPMPSVLPSGRRLQSLFASRVIELPRPTRDLLLLASLDGSGDLRILRAAAPQDAGLEHLEAAERARLLTVDESADQLAFRHPLMRSAVIDASTSGERRRAHRLLAALSPARSERRALHLADATVGPDEEVAALLEDAARGVLRRGDSVGAVQALIRAADLSGSAAERSRRLAEAAYIGADVTGELRSAGLLLEDARGAEAPSETSLEVAVGAASFLLNSDGDLEAAHRLLAAAIAAAIEREETSEATMVEALHTLNLNCSFWGQEEGWTAFAGFVEQFGPGAPLELRVRARVSEPWALERPLLGELDQAIAALEGQTDPSEIVRLGIASIYLDRLPACGGPLRRVVEDGRAGGAVASSIHALSMLGWNAYWCGEWDEAEVRFDEGLAICESKGYRLLSWPGKAGQGAVAAARGNLETARNRAAEIAEWASARGARGIESLAHHVLALASLSEGDFEAAFEAASATAPLGEIVSNRVHAPWVTLHLIESAVRTGRVDGARAHVRAMREADLPSVSSRLALTVAAGEAMVAPASEAESLFERALGLPEAELWAFDHARVQLAYGERLRRNRAGRRSRAQLRSAIATFERLGAAPWIARAETELAATSAQRPGSDDPGAPLLTPQELEIARLAAQGLTNKEIGARLYLSHRTVSAHLYRIFPKLEIRSRAMLHDALARLEADDG